MNSKKNNDNNVSGIDYTSGCESGWTSYLDSSYYSENHQLEKLTVGNGLNAEDHDEAYSYRSRKEEQDDLSMISDASSGPPINYNEDHHINEDYCFFHDNGSSSSYAYSAREFTGKSEKKNIHIKERGFRNQHSHLDDTASSPVFSYPKKDIITLSRNGITKENSQGFSATHYSKDKKVRKAIRFFTK